MEVNPYPMFSGTSGAMWQTKTTSAFPAPLVQEEVEEGPQIRVQEPESLQSRLTRKYLGLNPPELQIRLQVMPSGIVRASSSASMESPLERFKRSLDTFRLD